MRRALVLSLVFTVLNASCRTPSNAGNSETSESVSSGAKGRVWQQAIRQAQEEQQALQTVSLSTDKELAARLGLTVGKHDPKSSTFALGFGKPNFLLVFNKDNNITEDNKKSQKPEWAQSQFKPDSEMMPLYDKPIQFRFIANPIANCQKLITGNDFSKVISKQVFNRVPAADQSNLLCGYIKFTPVGSRPANRAIGDLAEANIYLTSDYRPYGLDLAVFKTRRESQRVLVQADPDSSVSSGVDAIPYDLPNLYILSRMIAKNSSQVSVKEVNSLVTPNDPYVQLQLAKAGISGDPCKGRKALQISYRDRMGLGKQVVGWCKGDAWPTMIESHKSLSVLVPKQIR